MIVFGHSLTFVELWCRQNLCSAAPFLATSPICATKLRAHRDPTCFVASETSTVHPTRCDPDRFPRTVSNRLFLANLNSFAFDFAARTKIGGSHLSSFILRQLPLLPSELVAREVPWAPGRSLGEWCTERVLELVYTAEDLKPFALACGFIGETFGWDKERRSLVRAELYAAFFIFYGLGRDDVEFVLNAFPLVRQQDQSEHGSFLTQERILERFDMYSTAVSSPGSGPGEQSPGVRIAT